VDINPVETPEWEVVFKLGNTPVVIVASFGHTVSNSTIGVACEDSTMVRHYAEMLRTAAFAIESARGWEFIDTGGGQFTSGNEESKPPW